jgi:hypothetical protein
MRRLPIRIERFWRSEKDVLTRQIRVMTFCGIFEAVGGIAAALMLGAVGVNLGTRFIASKEAPAPLQWKEAIVAAKSEDAIKVEVLNDITPLPGTAGFKTVLRSLPTDFLTEWSVKRGGMCGGQGMQWMC